MNKNKENYKKAEMLIKEYPLLLATIKDIDNQIKIIDCEDGLKAVSYDVPSVRTSNINKHTEKTALNNIEDKDRLNKQKEYLILRKKRLDSALESLDEREEIIIRQFYISGECWCNISYETGYSETQVRRVRTAALNKIAFILFSELASADIAI